MKKKINKDIISAKIKISSCKEITSNKEWPDIN